MRLVTTATALMKPRFELTLTQSPLAMPFSFAELLADLDELLRLDDRAEVRTFLVQ